MSKDDFTIKLDVPLTLCPEAMEEQRQLFKCAATMREAQEEDERKDWTKEDIQTLLEPLNQLIGLENVKTQFHDIVCQSIAQARRKEKNLFTQNMAHHMLFSGPPGTGKTTVARLTGHIFKELDILKSGHVVEVNRSDLVGEYIGQSEAYTKMKLDQARGGILFVDEAHELDSMGSSRDYGQRALGVITKYMEDKRDTMIVVFAGLTEEMQWMMRSYPALASRFVHRLEFSEYSLGQSILIFEKYCKDHEYVLSKLARKKLLDGFNASAEVVQKFSNARAVRHFFEQTMRRQSIRIVREDIYQKRELKRILPQDVQFEVSPYQEGKIIRFKGDDGRAS